MTTVSDLDWFALMNHLTSDEMPDTDELEDIVLRAALDHAETLELMR